MIMTSLCGGLGNQMFQYAIGRHLAYRQSVPLCFDVYALETDSLREFGLGGYSINGHIASDIEKRSGRPWYLCLPGRLHHFAYGFHSRIKYVKERKFTYNPSVINLTGPVYLDGYWQSERYFSDIASLMRSDFALLEPMAEPRRVILAQIGEVALSAVSVHVRRGDYVSNPVANAYHGTCTPEWYVEAMGRMAEVVEDPIFFVFSDDPVWARDNLPDRWPRVFVAPQGDGRDFEDMHLMAACQHHIIANSSFSWWGAWLDPNPATRIIAPAQWFKGAGHDTRDLIPSRWMRL